MYISRTPHEAKEQLSTSTKNKISKFFQILWIETYSEYLLLRDFDEILK